MASSDCSKYNFQNKVFLITGASSGIGAATAVHFAKLGAMLALNGRNEANLRKIADECERQGAEKPLLLVADIAVEENCEKIMSDAISHFKRLDGLVNNAGIMESGTIETTDVGQYDRIFQTNVRAVYRLTMLAVPHLIETKGTIVNVSSVAGTSSFPGILAYCMSKSALDQFTKCVALDLATKGVRVNSVNPGVIITDIHRRSGYDEETYRNYLEKCKTTHALGRVGQPEEVAECIAFLASDASSFVTGCLLPVDGGRNIMCPR